MSSALRETRRERGVDHADAIVVGLGSRLKGRILMSIIMSGNYRYIDSTKAVAGKETQVLTTRKKSLSGLDPRQSVPPTDSIVYVCTAIQSIKGPAG